MNNSSNLTSNEIVYGYLDDRLVYCPLQTFGLTRAVFDKALDVCMFVLYASEDGSMCYPALKSEIEWIN
jgi:hypothetical protein